MKYQIIAQTETGAFIILSKIYDTVWEAEDARKMFIEQSLHHWSYYVAEVIE